MSGIGSTKTGKTDYHILIDACQDALLRALEDGQLHGYTDEWCTWLSADDHIAHAYAHLQGARGSSSMPERGMHLQHALCRIAMALYQDENKG